ncbi:hypothetical protein NDU88_007385 [Pleurodeles waltl]|uniref:Uncharacterized protein n=1 Tax=Pleurodeles waltl TaxID=8319 RepID=A0AAV7UPF5_PLEWA|nr:hypothetical protein NDU88_007385 [Pleurodeles waltl]
MTATIAKRRGLRAAKTGPHQRPKSTLIIVAAGRRAGEAAASLRDAAVAVATRSAVPPWRWSSGRFPLR